MATVYYADNYRDGGGASDNSNAAGQVVRPFVFTAPALGTGDTINLCRLPGSMGIIFTSFLIDVPDLDTDSSLICSVGDSTDAERFVADQSAIGQGPGRISSVASATAATGIIGAILGTLPCVYIPNGALANKGDDDLILTISTGAGDANTNGKIIGWVTYVQFGVGPAVFGNEPR